MDAGEPSSAATGADPAAAIDAVRRLAVAIGADALAAEAAALDERLAEGRFFVACLGQFKRGKSTLLNALIGDTVLPTGVVPVTSAVTILRYGASRGARVVFVSGEAQPIDVSELSAYVAEAHNPENRRGVAAVEVCVPSALLASGMCLVDTPGLGSVFAGNTAVTRQFVPHVDAALVVLGADPPISGEELSLIEEVARETSAIVVVLNKADRLSPQEIDEARAFTARVIAKRLASFVDPVFEVSAAEQLTKGPTRDWKKLHATLEALAKTSGAALVQRAQTRGRSRLVDRLLHEIDEQRGALTRPHAESEHRIHVLRACVADAERSLRDLRPLFEAEQQALGRAFDEARERFLTAAEGEVAGDLDRAIGALGEAPLGDLRARSAELARTIAMQRVEAWAADVEPLGESLYRKAMDRFIGLVNGILERLASSGEPALASLPRALQPEAGFRARRKFHFHDLLTLAAPGFGTRLLDRLRSRDATVEAVKRDARAYLLRLLATNGAREANDLTERVLESRRRVESELLALLRALSAAAERSLARARERQAEGATAVEADLRRLESLREQVEGLRPTVRRTSLDGDAQE